MLYYTIDLFYIRGICLHGFRGTANKYEYMKNMNITSRDRLHRKHISSIVVQLLLSGPRRKHHSSVFVCGPLYGRPSRGRHLAVVPHATVILQVLFYSCISEQMDNGRCEAKTAK
jgi:hypothetical protein